MFLSVLPPGLYPSSQAYVYDIRSSRYLHKLQKFSDTVLSVTFHPGTPEVGPFFFLLCASVVSYFLFFPLLFTQHSGLHVPEFRELPFTHTNTHKRQIRDWVYLLVPIVHHQRHSEHQWFSRRIEGTARLSTSQHF